MSSDWCTIESDPGVFSELIRSIGVKGVELGELMTLEPEELEQLDPIYGLIFLFKWTQEAEPRETLDEYDPELFYASQVITNACATQAILSILMNCKDIDVGSELENLRNFCVGMSAQDRGYVIGNSEVIRTAHNSFAKQEPIQIEKVAAGDDDDVFHFISYVPFNGRLYELDGLQKGPIDLGETQSETWLAQAREAIQARIEKYAASEIRFNLLAVTKDQ
jgi:ubiquitin carboxyl-terminal hydrolase L5